jgi:hypothetical protein
MTVFVLWENHATGPIHRFGPHDFLTACVADRVGRERHELRRSRTIGGSSRGGDSNVLRELHRRQLWHAVPALVAVLDSDKIHRKLGGDARGQVADAEFAGWSARMEERCRESLRGDPEVPYQAERLTICFLDRNLETLLEILEGTTVGKDPIERDRILQRAAGDPAQIRRAAAAMPSWDHLVEVVAKVVARRIGG